MIYSMTGYAAVSKELPQGRLHLELKSVNSRYLDIQFRLHDELRSLESVLRELIINHIGRGKIECRVGLMPSPNQQTSLTLNESLLQQLALLERKVREYFPESPSPNIIEVLRLPSISQDQDLPLEALREDCIKLMEEGLTELNTAREREGDKLKKTIIERVSRMELLVQQVIPLIPQLYAAYQEKLATRLREVLVAVDQDRISQEIALFAAKIDVAEEIARLNSHLAEIKHIFNQGGKVGKKLDFLMQELNREANTLGSKSVSTEVTNVAMELKLLIEQMREQVQNIE